MNNPPSGDGKSTEKKVNYRIPKVSNLEKRLRHAVSNSTTALTVDLTQDMSNSTSNKARSSFSRAGFCVLRLVAYRESSAAAFTYTLLAALLVDLHGVSAVVLHGL